MELWPGGGVGRALGCGLLAAMSAAAAAVAGQHQSRTFGAENSTTTRSQSRIAQDDATKQQQSAGVLLSSLSLAECLLVFAMISLIFVSIVGNCLVCVAIFTDRRLRKLGNAFIVSLAIADLFVSCLVMTFALCNDLLNYWMFGDWFCDIWISFDVMCSTASILNLCAISLDRFVHIKDCLLYNQWMTRRVALSAVLAIWLISALVSFVPITLGWHKPTPDASLLALSALPNHQEAPQGGWPARLSAAAAAAAADEQHQEAGRPAQSLDQAHKQRREETHSRRPLRREAAQQNAGQAPSNLAALRCCELALGARENTINLTSSLRQRLAATAAPNELNKARHLAPISQVGKDTALEFDAKRLEAPLQRSEAQEGKRRLANSGALADFLSPRSSASSFSSNATTGAQKLAQTKEEARPREQVAEAQVSRKLQRARRQPRAQQTQLDEALAEEQRRPAEKQEQLEKQRQQALPPPPPLPQCMLTLTPTYALVSSTISFYIPCLIMLGLYSKLFACARGHVRSIRAISRAVPPTPVLQVAPAALARPAATSGNETEARLKHEQLATGRLRLVQNSALSAQTGATVVSFASPLVSSDGAKGPTEATVGSAKNRARKARSLFKPAARTWIKFGRRRATGSGSAPSAEAEAPPANDCGPLQRTAEQAHEHSPFLSGGGGGGGGGGGVRLDLVGAVAGARAGGAAKQQSNSTVPGGGACDNNNQQQSSHTATTSAAQQLKLQNSKQTTSQLATHKAAITLGIIMGTFLLCWVPFFCLNIIKAFCVDCIPSALFRAFTWLGYANSALNPIIYGIHNSEFRNAFNRIFFKHLTLKNGRQYLSRRFSYDLRHHHHHHHRHDQQQQRHQNHYTQRPLSGASDQQQLAAVAP